ncbi:MAG TPA: MBL fold metallo-hydrolase [Anaerolineae bacterium]|nr:MBL fold metallo-hydrolase [Anaerolineae bacterium]
MFELIFLGTSASSPSAHRSLSAHMLLHRQYRFLIDCGEGTQRQILKSGLGFKRLNRILLTHAHLDHILGLGGLVSTLTRWESLDEVEIYGGKATIDRVRDLLYKVVLRGNPPKAELNFITLKDGDVLVEDDKFKVSTFAVQHRGPGCFGFLFEEKARRPFLSHLADTLGVPNGPERGKLVSGNSITLADGTQITPDQVLGDTIQGTKYVHIGDVGKTARLVDICHAADVLTIESTYIEEDAAMASQFGHMTAARSAKFAQQIEAKTLILNHISRRYFERDIRSEAQAIFPNSYVARDFDHFEISRDGVKRKNLLR